MNETIPRKRRNLHAYLHRLLIVAPVFFSALPGFAADPYARVGYKAVLSSIAHGVSGVVTVVDQDTFRIDHFVYDGGGIQVYAYLASANENVAFVNGLQTGPQLRGTAYNGGTLIVDLPPGQTLDGYHAVSIWCVPAQMNFGSGSFQPPDYPRAGYSAILAPGQHSTSGLATIVDERTVRLDNFTYDGTAPLVFAYLGVTNRYADFLNGPRMTPQIARAYQNESLMVERPPGQSISGFGALSIWCVRFQVNFTSAAFPRAMHDLDLDGDIDPDDGAGLGNCLSGPASAHVGSATCRDADRDADGDVDLRDYQSLQQCASGPGSRAHPSCK